MLTLTRVYLENICQFEKLMVDIDVGLTAITGRNGAGKSNFIRAVMYGLTGLVDGTWGNQQLLQRDTSVVPGFVELTLKHDDSVLQLRRYAVSSPKFPDRLLCVSPEPDELAVRRKTVDSKLEEIIGLPMSMLFSVCWSRQSSLDRLLVASPALMDQFLYTLFRLDYIENVRDKVKKSITYIADFPQNIVNDLAQTTANIIVEEDTLVQLKEELPKQVELWSTRTQEQKHLLDLARTGITEQQRDTRLVDIDKLSADILKELNDFKTLAVPEMQYDEQVLKRAADTYSEVAHECDSLNESIGKAEESLDVTCTRIKAIKDELGTLAKRSEALQEIQSCDKKCILCGSPIHDMDAYMSSTGHMLGIEQMCSDAKDMVKLTDDAKDTLNATLKTLESKQSTDTEELEKNKKALTLLLQELDKLDKIISQQQAAKMYETKKKYCDTVKGTLSQLSKEQEELKNMSEFLPKDIEEKIKQSALASFLAESDKNDTEQSIYKHEITLASLKERRSLLQCQVDQKEINDQAEDILTSIVDILARDGAVALYMRQRIEQINQRLAEYMTLTTMPFKLYLNVESHRFEYQMMDGVVHSAVQLSGAQKNMAAVALQMALFSILSPVLHLFFIDEPSEALDDENKIVMADMFQRMTRLLPSVSGIMCVVTRDQLIIDSCNAVIKLSEVS